MERRAKKATEALQVKRGLWALPVTRVTPAWMAIKVTPDFPDGREEPASRDRKAISACQD